MKQKIFKALIELPDGEKPAMVKRLAKHFNLTESAIWRYANKAGIRLRAQRADKGKTSVEEWALEHAASLVNKSKRKNDKYTFDVKEVYKHMINDLGIAIDVTYPRFCELLRERGLTTDNFKKPTPHVQLLSEHPNQLHEFDVSICLQWYFDDKSGEIQENPDTKRKFYQNKMEQTVQKEMIGKKKLHRYVLVDHCSGAFFFWYYYDMGENAISGSDFFFKAWNTKKTLINEFLKVDYNGAYVFQGVPKILYTDKGAILRKQDMRNLMTALKVDVQFHEAGNPRAKGMAEGLMNIIEKGFESYLKIYGIKTIDQLNAFALKWCIEKNTLQDFRGAETSRCKLWTKIKQEHFRKCPPYDIWAKLIQPNPVTRKVAGDGKIEFGGKKYTVLDTNLCHKEVTVIPNAYEIPAIDVHSEGKVYTLQPNTIDEFNRIITPNAVNVGEYRKPKETTSQKFEKKAEKILTETYGVTFKGKKTKRTMQPPQSPAPETKLETDNIHILTPKSVEITVNPHNPVTNEPTKTITNRTPVKLIPLTEIIRLYVSEFGRITPDERDRLNTTYPAGVPINITATDIHDFLTKPHLTMAKLA